MPMIKTLMERKNESEVRIERNKLLRALDATRERMSHAEYAGVELTDLLIRAVHALERINSMKLAGREREQKLLRLLRKTIHYDGR